MKKNIWRILFWGIMSLIFMTFGIIGFMQDSSEAKKDEIILKAIVDRFNVSTKITQYEGINTKIKATAKGRKIKVVYSGAKEKVYTYDYSDGILYSSMIKNDSIGNNILIAMTDSIANYNGELLGNTFELFNSNEIKNYNLNQGIELTYDTAEIKIKLNTKIAVKPKQDEPIEEVISYFLVEDFKEQDKLDYDLKLTKNKITFLRESENIFAVSEETLTENSIESIKNILIYFYSTDYINYLSNVSIANKINYIDETIKIEFNPEKNVAEINAFNNDEFIKVEILNLN